MQFPHSDHPANRFPQQIELLLYCGRSEAVARDRLRAAARAVTAWPEALQTAERHKMLPLLGKRLRAGCRDLLPAEILRQLSAFEQQGMVRSHYLMRQLIELLRLFESHGIAAIPFKGPALAVMVYGEVNLRQSVDLDILVPASEISKAKDLLLGQGFALKSSLTPQQEAAVLRRQYHLAFFRPADRCLVELHWDIAPQYFSFPFDAMRLWQRAEKIKLDGVEILTPPPEDLLLLLCVHGTKHLWNRLVWICDVAMMIRNVQQLDLGKAVARAAELRSTRMLLLGLSLANKLFDAELPEPIGQRIRSDTAVQSLTRQVREQFIRQSQTVESLLARNLFHLKSRERWSDRLRYCALFATAAGTSEWALLNLPPHLSFLYSLLRPARLIRVYLAELWALKMAGRW